MFLPGSELVTDMKAAIHIPVLLIALGCGTAYSQEGFEGRIVAPEVEEPPQVVIKMTPPRSRNTAQQITISDEQGRFRFNELEQGRYLLEMYHNNELIRREVVDTRESPEKEIRLVPER